MNKPFLETSLEAWKIDLHEKHTSAGVTEVEANETAIKNQVLKRPEERTGVLMYTLDYLPQWYWTTKSLMSQVAEGPAAGPVDLVLRDLRRYQILSIGCNIKLSPHWNGSAALDSVDQIVS